MGGGPNKVIRRIAVLGICMIVAVGGIRAQAQGRSVTMPSKTTTVKEALAELQRQTALQPVVNYNYISPERQVVLSSETLGTEEFVRQVLEGTGLAGEIVGRHLLIVPEPPKPDQGEGAFSTMWRDDEVDETVEMETITFRIGSAIPETDFMSNSRIFDSLDRRLRDTAVLARLNHISVTAASSPDGNTANNERLAVARAQNTKGYLVRRYPHIAPEEVQTFSVGEEWSGLRRLVLEDTRTPDREKVLEILNNVDDEYKRDSLRTLSAGRTWRYIDANLMPYLRGATAITLHFWHPGYERRLDTVRVRNNSIAAGTGVQRVEIAAVKPKPLPVEPPPPVVIPEPEPRDLFVLKANLLSYLAGGLNLEAEVPIGRFWSVAGEVYFPIWWGWGATIEGRRWFGDRSTSPLLTGWFAGAYTGGYRYYTIGGTKDELRNIFHVGLSGGYAHTINPAGTLRMEYSLGLGYLRTGDRRLVIPTRAKVSLVWMLRAKQRSKDN